MGRAPAQPSPEALALLAESISSRYVPPVGGGWSEIGNHDSIGALLLATAQGLKPHDACLAAGIHVSTLNRWMKRAEDEPDSAYAALAQAMKEARAKGKLWHLQNIQRHALSEWTASAWTLERTDPEQFALRKDNADTPKVIVQIGAGAQDVKVGVIVQGGESIPPMASGSTPSPSLTGDLHSVSVER